MSPKHSHHDLVSLDSEIERAWERSRHLEPHSQEYSRWTLGLKKELTEFFETLAHRKTYSMPHPRQLQKWVKDFEDVSDPVEMFKHIIEGLSGQGLLTAGARHLGYIPGGGLPLAALGDWLSASVNPFCGDALASPVAAHIHQECLTTLNSWVGYDPLIAGGDITSGGSHATLLALKTARDRMGMRARNYHRSVVYLGEHTHHCARKSLEVIFGHEIIIRIVSSNEREQMDTVQLATQIAHDRDNGLIPVIVIATAGSTNLGSVDRLREISNLAKLSNMWFHVDAAYGGFFNLCPSAKYLFEGISEADSIVLDPHKGLFLPYGIGAVLFKTKTDQGTHGSLKTQGADYLQDRHHVHSGFKDESSCDEASLQAEFPPSPMDHSFELTRPFRSLRLWLALKTYGVGTFEAALEEKLLLAQYARLKLENMKQLEIIDAGDLSIVAFRVRSEDLPPTDIDHTEELLRSLLEDGNVFITSTTVRQRKVLRLAILSFRTHKADIDLTLQLIDKNINLIVEKSHDRITSK
jgi:aromatic-L-amino-acid decarboxylase